MDILKDKWSALYDVRSILLSIQSLLGGGVGCDVLLPRQCGLFLVDTHVSKVEAVKIMPLDFLVFSHIQTMKA